MQKSKRKHEDISRNWLIALLQGARDDVRNLRVIYFIPLLLMILVIYVHGQNMALARMKIVIYPFVTAIGNGSFIVLIFYLFTLIWLATLFIKAKRIFILVLPVALYISMLVLAIPLWGPKMIPIDETVIAHHRYYVSRFDTEYRTAWTDQLDYHYQPTHFVVVHKCDEFVGILCDTVFEDTNTESSSHRPIYQFEVVNNQLLLQWISSDSNHYQPESPPHFVIEGNLNEVE